MTERVFMVMAAPFMLAGPTLTSESGVPSGSTALVRRLEMGIVSGELAVRVNSAA